MARTDEGYFTSKDGTRLYWRLTQPEGAPRAHVALVHGYGDHSARYRFLTEHLVGEGYAVHGFDYRGHGRADGRRGWARRWPDFLDDLDAFWARVQRTAGDAKTFVFSHSHGGLMTVHALARGGLRGAHGVVMSAPYFELAIKAPFLKLMAARLMAPVAGWLPIATELTPAHLTRDEAVQRETAEDPLYGRVVTPGWFTQSLEAQAEVPRLAPKVTQPLFALWGAEDGVAASAAARTFVERAGSTDKQTREYPGMRHEPFNETGREQVFQDIAGWISAHL